MFGGEKTGIYWWGLTFCALSICELFGIFWYFSVLSWGVDLRYVAPFIFGGIVFLIVGLYMMRSGIKKGNPAG